ncbi:MAG: LEA type 2 family protein [Candidatus Marinimicrobia bacterium]|nr:LEA type 2 family protein [Candidatus Neomarinimicrobiota bacterium]
MKRQIALFTLFLIMSNCSELSQILKQVNIQKPTAEIQNISLEKLSLEKADLLFHIKISNPNPVAIHLAGFDYDLVLNENSFLKGDNGSKIDINASDDGFVNFPLTLNFQNLYNTYQGLKEADEILYTLNLGLNMELPFLGNVRIPISKSDQLPTVKIPGIQVKSINMDQLSLTKADMILQIEVDNPNKWALNLNKMNYNLIVNSKKWAVGDLSQKVSVQGKEKSILEIPFSLNYLDVGASVFSMIKNNQNFNYQLSGSADIGSSLKILQNFNFPFEKVGSIQLGQ